MIDYNYSSLAGNVLLGCAAAVAKKQNSTLTCIVATVLMQHPESSCDGSTELFIPEIECNRVMHYRLGRIGSTKIIGIGMFCSSLWGLVQWKWKKEKKPILSAVMTSRSIDALEEEDSFDNERGLNLTLGVIDPYLASILSFLNVNRNQFTRASPSARIHKDIFPHPLLPLPTMTNKIITISYHLEN